MLLVLLMACTNVAGLLLARGSARRQELAMRAALGAGRTRIVRQLIAESLFLSSIGGLLGIAVAWAGLRALPAISPPPNAPRLDALPVDWQMVVLTGLDVDRLRTHLRCRAHAGAVQRGPDRRVEGIAAWIQRPRSRQRSRSLLVAAQLACACMLLTGSGLLLKSFVRLAGRDLNFDPRGLLMFELRNPTFQFQHIAGSYKNAPYMAVDAAPRPSSTAFFAACACFRESSPSRASLLLPSTVLSCQSRL